MTSAMDLERLNACVRPVEDRGEIADLERKEVWMSAEPNPRDWWETLEVAPPCRKAGYGHGTFDRAWFRRSPGMPEDGPAQRREFGGVSFIHVARIPDPPERPSERGPVRLLVDKHHSVVFEKGRKVSIATAAGGRHFVRLTENPVQHEPTPVPDGWSIREVVLDADWLVELPCPTETYWMDRAESYQGPIRDLP